MYIKPWPICNFEWDPAKARANIKRHGISFDEAETTFYDDRALILLDPDHSAPDEERLVLIGLSGAFACSSSSIASSGACHPPDFRTAGNPV